MIISTCGFGSTGSSAVCDYLMECENVANFDAVEFNLSTMVDGLEDLEFHLMKQPTRQGSGIYAIQRFNKAIQNRTKEWCANTPIRPEQVRQLTQDFINAISQVSYVGFSPMIDKKHSEFLRHYLGESIILHRVLPYLEKKGWLKGNIDVYPLEKVNAAVMPSNFYEEAKKFIEGLLTLMGCDFSKIVTLDQAFTGNDPAKSFPFYTDPYAIVVDRDPRDLYIFSREVLRSRGRFMPSDTVENFVKYYRMLRDNQPYKIPNERILLIPFESMVYDYDNSISKIDQFLKVTNNRRKTIFNPELSVANTNLIRKFPQYAKDVDKIEACLPEYLFPFENYQGKFHNESNKMFFGKSPLNKK